MPLVTWTNSLALAWPCDLEFLRPGQFLALLGLLGVPIVLLGARSLAGLGPVRRWVAIGLRLLVLLMFLLIIGGLRWQRRHKDVEVIVLKDESESVRKLFRDYQANSFDEAVNHYLDVASASRQRQPDDRIGVIGFAENATIESIPGQGLRRDAKPIEEGGRATDIAGAVQLGLATFQHNAMRRMLLMSDGNDNRGDLEAALAAASSQKVPIDVMPLDYRIEHEVLMDRFIAPSWKNEKEPFTIEVFLRSTNTLPVTGKLFVQMIDSTGRPAAVRFGPNADLDYKAITIEPGPPAGNGLHRESITVPALESAGVYRFAATFEPGQIIRPSGSPPATGPAATGATLSENKRIEAFTFVRGKGKILFVDNFIDKNGQRGSGKALPDALAAEGIELETATIEQLNQLDLISLQNYDAVILGNVPYGYGGVDAQKADDLASYVHDMGGGLVMIGGPNAFGAGNWQASGRFQDILPVEMEIPAQRSMPKGALVMVIHSCEMPDGNTWGEQCALKAIDTLSSADEVGIISYGWNKGRAGWDFPLAPVGSGSAVRNAVRKMQLGDMPDFNDTLNLALNGDTPTGPCLLRSDARMKHIIIISDGDPAAPNGDLIKICQDKKISISTITVYTHNPGTKSAQMVEMAEQTKGRAYGPIESNPMQLPQIFIKEASIVRRSLIYEDMEHGIPVAFIGDEASDAVKGLRDLPSPLGMVLTARRTNTAQNDLRIPLVAGKNKDPLLAQWQTGLGRSVVFTSDATARWAPAWVASPAYGKFWAQVIRSVARAPMSSDFDIRTTQVGDKGKIVVEALNKDTGFMNFMSIFGKVVGPSGPADVRLVQTGPGAYEGEFDARDPGNYVALLSYAGKRGGGSLLTGMVVTSTRELRDLSSNDALLAQIAACTGGKVLPAFDPLRAHLFRREGLNISVSPLPVWERLIPILLALILLDVAGRRIAWDWAATRRFFVGGADYVRSFTTTRSVESAGAIDALRSVRGQAAETRAQTAPGPLPPPARPDPGAKFQAKGVEGDITSIVGGATDKPAPAASHKIESKGLGGYTSSLLDAKRRAQDEIRRKEKGE